MLRWLRSLFETQYRVLHIVEPDVDTYAVNYKWKVALWWNYVASFNREPYGMRRFDSSDEAFAFIDSMRNSRREVVLEASASAPLRGPPRENHGY